MNNVLGHIITPLQAHMTLTDEHKHMIWTQMNERWQLQCHFCTAKGHELKECPMKKHLDNFCLITNRRKEWGRVKYEAYYEGVLNGNKALKDRTEAKKKALESQQYVKTIPQKRRRLI